MNGLVIQYHDFENAKEELKNFSEQTTTELDLKKVDDSKRVGEWFGDFLLGRGIGLNHTVKGEELNELTMQIQSHFQSVNDTQIKLIKEFGQVYTALEALDNDYIQAILISIKATEETSKGVKKTQDNLRKVVDNQKKTIEELSKFKNEINSYIHLKDIDTLWNDCQKCDTKITELKKMLVQSDIVDQQNYIQEINNYIEEMKKQNEETSKTYSKKLKLAYILSGCGIGLSLIEFGMLIMRIM